MKEYTPNPVIVAKACELWLDMLDKPKFDALGNDRPKDSRDDPNDAMALAAIMSAANAERTTFSDEMKATFAKTLTKWLSNKVGWDAEAKAPVISTNGDYTTHLYVDYGPDAVLAEVAKEAQVPKARWPWKTAMNLGENYVNVSMGYAAETVYYYPVDGQWLVTTLSGSDITKVIEYIKGGKPTFTITD